MKSALRLLIAGPLFLTGCRVAHDVAVSSYHAVTEPAHFVSRQFEQPTPTPRPTDVTRPGHPIAPSPSPSERRVVAGSSKPKPSPAKKTTAQATPKPAPSPKVQAAAQQPLQFPTGKPVPDRPGYVYSPSDSSKYVDVSGYAPGSKVKDPYSGKIFLVP